MYHSPSDILRYLLIDLSVGTLPTDNQNWPIYVANEPNKPDNCITIYDTIGTDDGRSMIDGDIWKHDGIQVRVRSVDYRTGWDKITIVQETLAKQIRNTSIWVDDEPYLVTCAAKIADIL